MLKYRDNISNGEWDFDSLPLEEWPKEAEDLDNTFRTKINKPHVTSDKYKGNSKKFLDSIDIRAENVTKTTFEIIKNMKDFEMPLIGMQLRIRTQSQLNLIFLVMKVVEQNHIAEEITIATYTLNKEAYSILLDLVKSGRIKKLSLLIASSYSFRDPEYFEYLKKNTTEVAGKYDVHLVFAWVHFKITLIRCGENFYQIEGSMNYSQNNMAEQLLIENVKTSYLYDYDFIHNFSQQKNKALNIIC
ncbi:MAG: hypothetical protein Q8P20_08265 [bacterium]|nr:hypothetical protein [bacterium]